MNFIDLPTILAYRLLYTRPSVLLQLIPPGQRRPGLKARPLMDGPMTTGGVPNMDSNDGRCQAWIAQSVEHRARTRVSQVRLLLPPRVFHPPGRPGGQNTGRREADGSIGRLAGSRTNSRGGFTPGKRPRPDSSMAGGHAVRGFRCGQQTGDSRRAERGVDREITARTAEGVPPDEPTAQAALRSRPCGRISNCFPRPSSYYRPTAAIAVKGPSGIRVLPKRPSIGVGIAIGIDIEVIGHGILVEPDIDREYELKDIDIVPRPSDEMEESDYS